MILGERDVFGVTQDGASVWQAEEGDDSITFICNAVRDGRFDHVRKRDMELIAHCLNNHKRLLCSLKEVMEKLDDCSSPEAWDFYTKAEEAIKQAELIKV